mmetsp:Transcript_66791/g.145686  ORF Transcript_66791/g.145686 Transcript_66791/m.145686 type:complete len:82 (-) Transcript_66791:28-273(-)
MVGRRSDKWDFSRAMSIVNETPNPGEPSQYHGSLSNTQCWCYQRILVYTLSWNIVSSSMPFMMNLPAAAAHNAAVLVWRAL